MNAVKTKKAEKGTKKMAMHLRRAVDRQNQARKACGLPILKVEVRSCLVCGTRFESIGNRLCGCVSRKVPFLAGTEVLLN